MRQRAQTKEEAQAKCLALSWAQCGHRLRQRVLKYAAKTRGLFGHAQKQEKGEEVTEDEADYKIKLLLNNPFARAMERDVSAASKNGASVRVQDAAAQIQGAAVPRAARHTNGEVGMNINALQAINVERARRWHGDAGLLDWSALEWAGAMCGEAGEAANAAKKHKRMESKLASINGPGRSYEDLDAAKAHVAKECADTILYALLTMARVGCGDPEAVLRDVFNKKSKEYGFPERI
jgi:NTP pyrophosphatase (non-canonical NTP hydrolase)